MADDDPGVPLGHYLHQHPGSGVRFYCRACAASYDAPVAAVVERLKARALGGEQTGVREVARLSTQPCRRCGAVRWETSPAFTLLEPDSAREGRKE